MMWLKQGFRKTIKPLNICDILINYLDDYLFGKNVKNNLMTFISIHNICYEGNRRKKINVRWAFCRNRIKRFMYI